MVLQSTNRNFHLIYLGVIFLIIGVGYTFLKSKPKEKIVTVTKTQIVYKDVIKEKKVYLNKTIVTRKVNGDVITEIDRGGSETKIEAKTQISSIISSKTVEKFLSSYSIDTLYNIPTNSISNPTFDYKNIEMIVGIRIFNLPIFGLIGTEGTFNKLKIGLRVEM